MMTVFLALLPMEPRLAPLGRLTLMGQSVICNLVYSVLLLPEDN
jgi:hypothetical protein